MAHLGANLPGLLVLHMWTDQPGKGGHGLPHQDFYLNRVHTVVIIYLWCRQTAHDAQTEQQVLNLSGQAGRWGAVIGADRVV